MEVSERYERWIARADEEAIIANKSAGPRGDKATRMAQVYLKLAELELTTHHLRRLTRRVASLETRVGKLLAAEETPATDDALDAGERMDDDVFTDLYDPAADDEDFDDDEVTGAAV